MSGRDENRVFVGGLAWETNDRQLQDAFSRYGKILECVVVADRDTGRSRGFGFVTFVDHRAMDDAISDMHGRELDGRIISVNKAKPKLGGGGGGDDDGFDHGRDYISGGGGGRRGGGGGGGGGDRSATTDCFKCGRPGHFARECPLSDGGGGGGGGGGRFSSQFGRSRVDPYDDRTGRGGRYGDRDLREYGGGRDGGRYNDPPYSSDRYNGGGGGGGGGGRYGPGRESYGSERYELQGDYGRDRGYIRDVGPRAGVDRYGSGGPDRYERGSYKERAVGPYDRHRRGDRMSPPYERY